MKNYLSLLLALIIVGIAHAGTPSPVITNNSSQVIGVLAPDSSGGMSMIGSLGIGDSYNTATDTWTLADGTVYHPAASGWNGITPSQFNNLPAIMTRTPDGTTTGMGMPGMTNSFFTPPFDGNVTDAILSGSSPFLTASSGGEWTQIAQNAPPIDPLAFQNLANGSGSGTWVTPGTTAPDGTVASWWTNDNSQPTADQLGVDSVMTGTQKLVRLSQWIFGSVATIGIIVLGYLVTKRFVRKIQPAASTGNKVGTATVAKL